MVAEMSMIRDANLSRAGGRPLTEGRHVATRISIGNDGPARRPLHSSYVEQPIGDSATVGARAVVTRDVAAGTTVVGVRPGSPGRHGAGLDLQVQVQDRGVGPRSRPRVQVRPIARHRSPVSQSAVALNALRRRRTGSAAGCRSAARHTVNPTSCNRSLTAR